MKYLLLSLILVSTPIFASEPAKYITELVCENPTGCPFENGVCIGCVEKKTHPPAPTINNYNKTEIHNHHYKTDKSPFNNSNLFSCCSNFKSVCDLTAI